LGIIQPEVMMSRGRQALWCEICSVRRESTCSTVKFRELDTLDRIATRIQYRRGETVFTEGEAARDFYIIRSGDISKSKKKRNGLGQIIGFGGAGSVLGLGDQRHYGHTTRALNAIRLCRIDKGDLEHLMKRLPAIRRRLRDVAIDEIAASHEHMLCIGRMGATERVATFLMAQIGQEEDSSEDSAAFVLPMCRRDVANYLCLTIETVSRELTLLREKGLIELVETYGVLVPDISALARTAQPS